MTKDKHRRLKSYLFLDLNRIENQTQNNFAVIVGLLVVLLFGAFWYTQSLNKKLENNGIETSAVVINIIRNYYRMNDMDGKWVKNRFIQYEFEDSNATVKGTYEIRDPLYSEYFDQKIGTGDSIRIIYDPENPSNSKILKK